MPVSPGGGTTLGYTPLNKAGDTLTGNLLFSADATHTIGASGDTRPAAVHVANQVYVGPVTNTGPTGKLHATETANTQLSVFIEHTGTGSAGRSRLQFGNKAADTDLVFSAYNSGHSGNGLLAAPAASLCELAANSNASGLALGCRGAVPIWFATSGSRRWSVLSGGDLACLDSTKGLILKSPDGNYWRVSIDNAGALSTTSLGLSLP